MPAIELAPFEYEGLTLRPWQRADLDRLAALVTDPEVMARAGGALRTDEVAGLLDRYLREDNPRLLVAVCALDAEGAHVGSAQLVRSNALEDAIELGYLVRPEHQGRGHATRIARALVELARARFPGADLIATVDPAHAASIRVLEKAGLHRVTGFVEAERGEVLLYRAR